jgi:DNA-binding MarR family transcriptional regulator
MTGRPPSLLALPSYVSSQVARYAYRHLKNALAEDDLLLPQYGMLVALDDFGPLSQQQVAESLDMDKSHLVAKIDKLEQRGLLARQRDPVDRRRHRVVLTPQGKELVDRVRPIAEESQQRALGVLTAAEREVLSSLLVRVLAANDGGID